MEEENGEGNVGNFVNQRIGVANRFVRHFTHFNGKMLK